VLLLPVATRYEQEGGGTETTTERRIIFSPEVPGHQVGEARTEWRVFADVVARARPDLAGRFAWSDGAALRQEIADIVPLYAGIERLSASGDQVQYGGRHLAPEGHFPTPSGRARFSPGQFFVSTRRGKQFNSMVQADVDPLNGAARNDVLMDRDDAGRLGLAEGDRVVLRSPVGSYAGRVRLARLAPQSLQVHWPEGNVLIASGPDHRVPGSKTPDYNAVVTVEPVERAGTPVTISS
jgi:anaerobic selenocysteine-containing dehydrogenase